LTATMLPPTNVRMSVASPIVAPKTPTAPGKLAGCRDRAYVGEGFAVDGTESDADENLAEQVDGGSRRQCQDHTAHQPDEQRRHEDSTSTEPVIASV